MPPNVESTLEDSRRASPKRAHLRPAQVVAWSLISPAGESSSNAAHPLVLCEGAVHFQRGPIQLGDLDRRNPRLSRTAALLERAADLIREPVRRLISKVGPSRVGIILGSSTGGIDRTEAALIHAHRHGTLPSDYSFDLSHSHHTLLQLLQEWLGISGPCYVVSAACASSAKAIAAAQRLIHVGECDAVLTGGADGLCELTQNGFASLGLVSPDGCQPFTQGRKGLGLGEGSSLLLLAHSEPGEVSLLGAGESNDAFDLTAPHPLGLGAELAIARALDAAGLDPSDVDYVNAHGTGTAKNDGLESSVLSRVLGPQVRYSSTKHRTQHQLGTAGATEALVCVEAITKAHWPLNVSEPPADPTLAVAPLVQAPQGRGPSIALSNSFAFGGANACLAFGKSSRPHQAIPKRRVFLMSHGYWLARTPDQLAPAEILPRRMRGRSSPLTRIVAELFTSLEARLSPAARPLDRREVALVLGSAYGEMSTSLELLDEIARGERVSPLAFQASVHNAALGLLTQVLENRSYATALAAGSSSFAMSLLDASVWIRALGGDAVVLVADEAGPPSLLGGKTFPALGVGVVLRSSDEPPPGALAELCGIETCKRTNGPAHLGLAAEVPLELGPLDDAPEAEGFALLEWLESSRSTSPEAVRVGPTTLLHVLRC